jgi:GAF domain-containing protein
MERGRGMEPIPETVEAIEEFGPFGSFGVDLVADLRESGRMVQEIVPDCVGFSLATEEHGVTFTVLANAVDVAVLDAIQYLSSGPCVAAVENQDHAPSGFDLEGLLDEYSWQLFGHATAAKGVRSTLTLPLLADERVVGSINLYGGSCRTFAGHHQALADLFDAWAPGAVTNADLSFATLSEARRAPRVLREETALQAAIGIVAARAGVGVSDAADRLRDAALRAGVSVHELAEAVVEAQSNGAGE